MSEQRVWSRRQWLQSTSCGFGYVALAALCHEAAAREGAASANPLAPRAPHFPPRAKHVIFMYMQGGPSHVDTFDYKPQLAKDADKSADQRGRRVWMPSPWKFRRRGQSGVWISDLFPHLAQHADQLCIINGMYTDVPNHRAATVLLQTGEFRFVRPSMGAWINYGLGTENQNLPGFVVLNPRVGDTLTYGSGFLPAPYQGTPVRLGAAPRRRNPRRRPTVPSPIPNLKNPYLDPDSQHKQLELIQWMNRRRLQQDQVHPELEGVIQSYELAFRMQTTVPELVDLSNESEKTLELYGVGPGKVTDRFGRQCLLARRLVENGVRFVMLNHGSWDQHRALRQRLGRNCQETDQPIAALIADLKARGLLEETLIVWCGEFGRTPHVQNNDGRDHNSRGFTAWMCGGGVRGGQHYGKTDPHGVEAVEDKVHIHDLHATILHLLGLDHKRLTFRFSGRDFRLTGVSGSVVQGIIG